VYKVIETRTLWQSSDDDVTPLITIEAEMSGSDRRWPVRDGHRIVGMTVGVSVNGVTVGEDDLWGVQHGTGTDGAEADAWELTPAEYPSPGAVIMGSPLSGVVVEALATAQHWLTEVGAGQDVQAALTAALLWADPNDPEHQEPSATEQPKGKQDLIIVTYDWDSETYKVSARASKDQDWSIFIGQKFDGLMSLARDVVTGG
jgi:hypothetical protein